jgi:hypothetical protein
MRAFLLILIVRSRFVKRSVLAAGLAAACASAAALRAVDLGWRRMESSVTSDARWIWSRDDVKTPAPARFTATRSIAVDADAPAARAKIFVDRSYRLFLDEKSVGSGSMRPGDPLDVWDLGGRLTRGTHLFAIEAESPTGVGGILFALDLPPGRGRGALVSDGSWSIAGGPAFVWGAPPMFPWGFPGLRR